MFCKITADINIYKLNVALNEYRYKQPGFIDSAMAKMRSLPDRMP